MMGANRYQSRAYLDANGSRTIRSQHAVQTAGRPVLITVNGERFELDHPVSLVDLLARLDIDPRRVAIEHNLSILKRHTFSDVILREGDTLEIVNFVGGG